MKPCKKRQTREAYGRYEIYSEWTGELMNWRSTKQEAIRFCHEYLLLHGDMKVVDRRTGEVVFETAR